MRIKVLLIILLIFYSGLFAQRLYKISVNVDGKETTLSYLVRSGLDYTSGKELARILSASIFYNSDASKLELKFIDYTLKVTANNQFLILNRKTDGAQTIFQIPIAAIQIQDDVYIPLIYCINYLSLAYGKKIDYDDRKKNLNITNELFEPGNLFSQKETKPKEQIQPQPQNTKPSSKYDVSSISIEEKSNGTLIRFTANRRINIPRHSISNGILYLFLSGVTVAPNIADIVKPVGLVKKVKRAVISSKNVQLEFSLDDNYLSSEAFQDLESNDIIITVHNKFFYSSPAIEDEKAKWIFDAVVIDAGHGGKDPGAIGISGVKEKEINLSIALQLGSLIEKNLPAIKIIYTRKTDEFIELFRRGKIANENGGKLFISIHCNSMEKKGTDFRGFEVYLLRPGRTESAIRIAEFENSVIKYEDNPDRYQKLTDENFILVSMAHSQYMRYSERFSDLLNQEWKRKVEIPSLGIKQAGFYVLVGASMPSVLIEGGFLSNRKDEKHLASIAGQNEIAQSIFGTIKKYKENYDKEIEN